MQRLPRHRSALSQHRVRSLYGNGKKTQTTENPFHWNALEDDRPGPTVVECDALVRAQLDELTKSRKLLFRVGSPPVFPLLVCDDISIIIKNTLQAASVKKNDVFFLLQSLYLSLSQVTFH